MAGSSLGSFEPNPALAWVTQRFFQHIEVDETWASSVRAADARGTVLYVLRNLSFVDFLALDYLTKKLDLPKVRFANDLGLWVLEPMGRGWRSALRPPSEPEETARLRRAIDEGASAALFLKRPPTLLEPAPVVRRRGGGGHALPSRGKAEGDAFLRAVLDAQRSRSTPILLVPQVFVWTRSPDAQKQNVVDTLFGPREWPGKIRTVSQFLMNYRHVTLRAGEPVDVKAFLEHETASGPESDDVLVRRLTYTLLRRLERERRTVTGPARKPADRLRDQVLRSPRLQKVIRDMAGAGDAERRVLSWRALSMLRELEAQIDPNALRALDTAFDATVARMYSSIDVDDDGIARIREASKDGTLVLLPSHKSHIDYLVLTRIFLHANLPAPLVAAGDNLAFFPLGPVLRRAGAFFIRRSFKGDRLYGAVVEAYMRRLLKDGWSLEFFLEGGRSRTGKLLPPKVGLLSIVVDAALGAAERSADDTKSPRRKIYFCPISIGYERLVEEREYVRELTGGEKQKEDVRGLASAAKTALGRYGRLNVQFGELLTLEGVLEEIGGAVPSSDPAARTRATEDAGSPATSARLRTGSLSPAKRRALVSRLAYRVMNEINRVTAVTPSALVATSLLTHRKRGLSQVELVASCHRLAAMLAAMGARFTPSLLAASDEAGTNRSFAGLREAALREACDLFVRAGHVEVHVPGVPVGESTRGAARLDADAVYIVPDTARLSLDLAKNLLVHFFVSRAMIALPLVAAAERGEGPIEAEVLAERVQALSRLFKFEFQFRADATFETIFAETLGAMTSDGELVRGEDSAVSIAAEEEPRERVILHARMLESFCEGYRVAARGLGALLKGALTPKELAKRALASGERMFLAGEIRHREAIQRPVIENALLAFVDQGYLSRTNGKLVLADSFADAAAVATIEGRIASYLPGG